MSGADLEGRAVLVTGGTAGIGLATGLLFGRCGADVTLTHRWGSADEDELRARFAAAGAPAPRLLEANAANPDDVSRVMDTMRETHDSLHALISNVAFAQLVHGFPDYRLRGLLQSVEYSAWPLASHLLAARERFGAWPRYAVAVSSRGAREYHRFYDFAGAAKAVLETLVRYLAQRLFEEDCRVNAVQPRWVDTESLAATEGTEFVEHVRATPVQGLMQHPDEVAGVILALCSGWLDGMRGQVLTVDHGTAFFDNLMRGYAESRAAIHPNPSQEEPRESQ